MINMKRLMDIVHIIRWWRAEERHRRAMMKELTEMVEASGALKCGADVETKTDQS